MGSATLHVILESQTRLATVVKAHWHTFFASHLHLSILSHCLSASPPDQTVGSHILVSGFHCGEPFRFQAYKKGNCWGLATGHLMIKKDLVELGNRGKGQ